MQRKSTPKAAKAAQAAKARMMSRRPETRVLGKLLMAELGVCHDVSVILLNELSAFDLVKCSMVCASLRRLIDTHCSDKFSKDLRWWHGPATVLSSKQLYTASWLGDRCQFLLLTSLDSYYERSDWMFHTTSALHSLVRMRKHIFLPVPHPCIQIRGEKKSVAQIFDKGFISVDVLCWRIRSVRTSASHNHLQSVKLSAVEYVSNSGRVSINMTAPLIMIVDMVQSQNLSLRCLWVMRGVQQCMHCHQRPKAVQSWDARDPSHRVLCSMCCDVLYARESQLKRRWKVVPSSLPTQQIFRVHYIQTGPHYFLRQSIPERYVLKSAVAAFYKCADWGNFIKNNHRLQKTPKKNNTQAKFYFREKWW